MSHPTSTIHRSIMFWTLSLLLYCIGVALFTQQNYQTSKRQLLQGVDRQLKTAAQLLPANIDDRFQDSVLRHDTAQADETLANTHLLASYAEKTGVDRLYSMVVINKKIFITASSTASNDHDAEMLTASLTNRSREALAAIQEANRYGRIQSFESKATDRRIRSLFIPLRTANGTRYITAADSDITALYNGLQTEIYRSILEGLLLLLFASPFLYTVIRQFSLQCKSARQELQKRLQELALSKRINNHYLMTFRVNALGQVMEISDAYAKKTGIDPQHYLGNHFKELFGDTINYENLRATYEAITNAKPLEFCDELSQEKTCSFYAKVNILPWTPELSDRRNNKPGTPPQELEQVYESGAVFVIEDLSHVKRLEANLVRDEQTRLYNRRYFNEVVPNEINRARRENRKLLMLLLELEPQYFSDQSDKAAQLIPQLAHKLQRLCQRSSDFVFRLNEYEFAIVCTSESHTAATAFAKKVQQQVESTLQLLNDDLHHSPPQYFSIGISTNSSLAPLSLGEFYRRAHQSIQHQHAIHTQQVKFTLQ